MARKILLVGGNGPQLEELLNSCALPFASGDEAALRALTGAALPAAVIFDVRGQSELPASIAELKRHHPSLGIIIVATQLDPGMMLQAIRVGVNEFLSEPLQADDLRNALDRVSAVPAPDVHGKAFAFIGAKGGVGTTTVAVNVATALAQTGPGRVLFVDLHAAYGDAALLFGAEPRFSILDALENIHRIDAAFLKGLIATTQVRVDVLASSDRALVPPIDAQQLRTLLEFVKTQYAYVVLDVPRSASGVIDALDSANSILVVANQELSAVRAAARITATLRHRYSKEHVQVVVSRLDSESSITQQDVEGVIGSRVKYVIPSNYRIALEALNRGRPLVTENHNKLSASLVGFARSLADVTPKKKEEPVRQAGLLGRLTGRR